MKIISYIVGTIAVTGLLGCDLSAPQDEQQKTSGTNSTAVDAAIPKQTIPVVSSFTPWTCPANPGTAPSGEMTAERVESANNLRQEPGLYEGPVWVTDSLYFSDFNFEQGFPSRIQRLKQDGSIETVVADSGTNGLAVDIDGYLIGATHKTKSISRFYIQNNEIVEIVNSFNGNAFNSPNDLTEARDGTVYFTDPDFQRNAAPGGQDETRVYRVAANGTISVVDDTIANPNGISLSPEQDVLYVAGGGERGFIRAYPIVDGVPGEGKNLVENVTVPDGMAIDCLGNIYATEHSLQRVRVFSPQGKQLAVINVDSKITNAAFGGSEGKTLYLSGMGAIWKIELPVAGFPY